MRRDSGCRYLHFGYESGNERVLKLMDKATTTDVITKHLQLSADAGIWNHCMGFFGFPAKRERMPGRRLNFSKRTKSMFIRSASVRSTLAGITPVAKNPEKWGVTAYKNPEWDLALDYYYTVKDGMSIEEAERVFQEFERNHNPGWDLRLFIREYIFLYIARFGLQKLPDSAIIRRRFRMSPHGGVRTLKKTSASFSRR